MTEVEELKKKLAEREQSLRRAWTVLQIARKLVEHSRGKELPRPDAKSFDAEGKIVCEALGDELADLHRKLNKAVKTVDDLWEFHMGRNRNTLMQRERVQTKDFPRLKEKAIEEFRRTAYGPFKPPEVIEKGVTGWQGSG